MSALLFDYTNDLIATLLGRPVDEHVGMILGDDAIHREGEWLGVREMIECRQHTVGKILVITHYARDRSQFGRCSIARAKEAVRAVPSFLPGAGWSSDDRRAGTGCVGLVAHGGSSLIERRMIQ